MSKIKQLFMSFALAFAFVAAPVAAAPVLAATISEGGISENLGGGVEATGTDVSAEEADSKVNGIVTLAINSFSWIVGIISVIMIIIGGLKYIMSGGDSGNVTGAKNTILYAIIGLVVVALAQVIVLFVLDKATSA